jgi:hypothetical protein
MYEGKATVAQAFDSNVSSKFHFLADVSMIARLYNNAMLNHPEEKVKFNETKVELEKFIEQKINEVFKNIKYKVIPIQKLVRVQIGSALITLKNLSER